MAIPNSSDILQAVIEATPDAIFVKDLEGRYVLINHAAARFLRLPPASIVGKDDLELYPEATARRFMADDQRVLAAGEPQAFEGVATSAVGTQAYLVTKGVYRDRTGAILGLYGISHDITELRQAQATLEQTRAALFQSQKMEAVGQLTGGIAHDFNNLVAVILGNLELLRRHLPADPVALELIDEASRAAAHGQDLTSDLLTFSGGRHLNPRPVNVNALVERMSRLLARTLGRAIEVMTFTSPDTGVAHVDPAALESALLNVALNARDAMPEGGPLTIRTAVTNIPRADTLDADLKPGRYAMVSIEDAGTGMTQDVLARIFEPFFTTKPSGRGTGLGLSMVYGFARQSGGTVTAESIPGRGTTIRIFLPEAATDATSWPNQDGPLMHLRVVVLAGFLSVAFHAATAHAALGADLDVEVRGQTLTLTIYRPASGFPVKGTVLMGSGDAGWRGLCVNLAEFLSAQGYIVAGINSRLYLSAFAAGTSHLDVEQIPGDYETIAAALRARNLLRRPTIIAGVSEGAALAVAAAAVPGARAWADGVVALGLPATAELAWRWKDALSWITKHDPDEPFFRVETIIARVAPLPLLMLQSTHDEYIPPADYQALERAAQEPKRQVLIDARNHRFTGALPQVEAQLLSGLTWILEVNGRSGSDTTVR
jgi:PAS domain S-box-containing protein